MTVDLDRALEKFLKNPEKRVRFYIAFNIAIIVVNLAIIAGLAVLFLRIAGII